MAISLALTGCLGYRLGPTNGEVAGGRSIQVNPFVNKTAEPRLSDALNNALRKNLQNDGTYRLETREEGDIIVTGTITRYHRVHLSFEPKDVLTVRDYNIFLTAHVTARDRLTDKILLEQDITGRTILRVGTDLPSAERQALPLLAEDLARNITSRLVDGDW